MGNYRERVAGMAKYWAPNAHFFHVVFAAFNREDAWGVYQVVAHARALLEQGMLCIAERQYCH